MEDKIKFQFDLYQHHFKQPLRTSHGVWRIREGIIIRLTNQAGIVSQGEIAPLPWFGSETLSQARQFCQQQGKTISKQEVAAIPDHLPCCQFALASAWLNLEQNDQDDPAKDLHYCYLLPTGEAALTDWEHIYQTQTASTFKWKIGVDPLEKEIGILKQLSRNFPSDIKLRLDANGGLNYSQAQRLLSVTDNLKAIEFIEQPLSPHNLGSMIQLNQEHPTPIALDESVASFRQLQSTYQQGWQGIYVIKAAIMGFPGKLNQFCQDKSLDVVFSSVFETEVGRNAVLKMAQELDHPRALGFGVEHYWRC